MSREHARPACRKADATRSAQRVRTDHGPEFGSDFTSHLHDLGIAHRRIPPGTPEANGKVERSRRTDADEFYRRTVFSTPAQLVKKLGGWEHEYNHRRPHLALNGKTPTERLIELRISDPPPIGPKSNS